MVTKFDYHHIIVTWKLQHVLTAIFIWKTKFYQLDSQHLQAKFVAHKIQNIIYMQNLIRNLSLIKRQTTTMLNTCNH